MEGVVGVGCVDSVDCGEGFVGRDGYLTRGERDWIESIALKLR
jgi:hypothetical protein